MLENSKDNWKSEIIQYALKHQVKWRENVLLKSTILDEKAYYFDLLKNSQTNYMVKESQNRMKIQSNYLTFDI